MLERHTFIVRVNLPARRPIVEDVSTREQIQLPDLVSIAEEIERRLDGRGSAPGRGDDGRLDDR